MQSPGVSVASWVGGGGGCSGNCQVIDVEVVGRVFTQEEGPRPLNSTGRHGHLVKSTGDMKPIYLRKFITDTT